MTFNTFDIFLASNENSRLNSIVPECPKVLPKDNISHLKQDDPDTVATASIETETENGSSTKRASNKNTLFGWQSSLAERTRSAKKQIKKLMDEKTPKTLKDLLKTIANSIYGKNDTNHYQVSCFFSKV